MLFTLPDEATAVPSPNYSAAAALVHLTAIVAAADGIVSAEERQHLAKHLERGLRLDAAECVRLEAHLDYLSTGTPDARNDLRRVEALPAEERASVGAFLVDVAAADGDISPEEVRTLMTIFGHLGLSHTELFRLLSTRVADVGDPGPVTVIERQQSREREVPEPPDLALSASVSQAAERRRQHPAESPDGALSPGVPLDAAAIKRTLAEDARTRVLLEGIFADEDDSVEVASLDGTASAHGPLMGDAADLEEYCNGSRIVSGFGSLITQRRCGSMAL